jgi:hypothetical protein
MFERVPWTKGKTQPARLSQTQTPKASCFMADRLERKAYLLGIERGDSLAGKGDKGQEARIA